MEPVKGTTFQEHLFIGQWQQRQFAEMRNNLPTDCVLLVMDFGKTEQYGIRTNLNLLTIRQNK